MRKVTFPPSDTPLHRFLQAMRYNTMHKHPEFLQEVGHATMQRRADELRALGWEVEMQAVQDPLPDQPHRQVALYYIGEHSLSKATGEDIDG